MRWVCCCMVGCFLGYKATAQLDLQGTVQNKAGQPIAEAFVWLEPTQISTTTNANGRYRFSDLPQGSYVLTFSATGYQNQRLEVVLEQTSGAVSCTLDSLSITFDRDILVEEDAYYLDPAISGVTLLRSKTLQVVDLEESLGNMAANNARELYKTIPGLNIWENDNSGIQLNIGGRGLSPNRTSNFNTRQNGYDISADALGYPETYYTPPAQALQRIEVLRGAASLQFGTQFGGMLNFVMKQGAEDRKLEWVSEQTYGGFNFFNTFNSLGGTIGKFNYYVFYQYKRGDGWRPNADFQVHNGYAQVEYRPNERWRIRAEQTVMQYVAHQPGGLTDREFEQDARQSKRARNWFRVNWNISALTVEHEFSAMTRLNWRTFFLTGGRQSLGNLQAINRPDYGTARDLIQGQYANFGTELRLVHRYTLGQHVSALVTGIRAYRGQTQQRQGYSNEGSTGTWEDFTLAPAPDGILQSDYAFPSLNGALFAEHLFALSERWSITPGVRLEYIQTQAQGYYQDLVVVPSRTGLDTLRNDAIREQRSNNRAVFLAGIGASYKWNPNAEVYANFSQNYKGINFNDLRINNPNQEVDPNLQDEYGFNADLGIKANYKGVLQINATLFYLSYQRRIGNLQDERANPNNPALIEPYTLRTNVGDARIFGGELFGSIDCWRIWTAQRESPWSCTIFVNASLLDGRYTQTSNSFAAGKQLEFVAPFILRTGLTLSYEGFRLNYQYAYTAQHYSDATNAEWVPNAVVGLIPSYGVMDCSAQYQWRWLSLQVGINNLADARYFTRRATSYPGPGILPADGRSAYVSLRWTLGVE